MPATFRFLTAIAASLAPSVLLSGNDSPVVTSSCAIAVFAQEAG
jgi:hypothetical protein